MKKTALCLAVLLLLTLSLSSCYVNIPTDYEFEYGIEGIASGIEYLDRYAPLIEEIDRAVYF